MKSLDMREMTAEELENHKADLIDELVNLRMKHALAQVDNPLRLRHVRREIARAATILKQKHAGAQPGEAR